MFEKLPEPIQAGTTDITSTTSNTSTITLQYQPLILQLNSSIDNSQRISREKLLSEKYFMNEENLDIGYQIYLFTHKNLK